MIRLGSFIYCNVPQCISTSMRAFEFLADLKLRTYLTLSLPVTRICVNFSTVYNDTLVAKGLINVLYSPGLLQDLYNYVGHSGKNYY